MVFLASFSFTVDCFFPPVQSIAGEDCPVIRERNICRFYVHIGYGNSIHWRKGIVSTHSALVFPDYNGNCMKSKFIFYKVEARNFETGKYHRDELICFILDEDTKAPQEIVLSTYNPFFFFYCTHTLLLFVNWWYISSVLIEYGGDNKIGVKYIPVGNHLEERWVVFFLVLSSHLDFFL